jgi:hypothetical protein
MTQTRVETGVNQQGRMKWELQKNRVSNKVLTRAE